MTLTCELLIQAIREELRQVIDPEVGLNIIEMGLVYGIGAKDGNVRIEMTLTTAGCPMKDYMETEVRAVLERMPDVKSAEIEFVWAPMWTPDKIDPEALERLRSGNRQ